LLTAIERAASSLPPRLTGGGGACHASAEPFLADDGAANFELGLGRAMSIARLLHDVVKERRVVLTTEEAKTLTCAGAMRNASQNGAQ
jgi:hypothetical protein